MNAFVLPFPSLSLSLPFPVTRKQDKETFILEILSKQKLLSKKDKSLLILFIS